jgi:hypothetical protein
MNDLYDKALEVARTYDVSTPKDGLVLYSVSFLPTKENREQAFAYVKANPQKMVIEHTDCGAKLIELGLASSDNGLSDEQIADIWSVASKRLINAAQGEVRAFVKGADSRSVFRSMELPNILSNPQITGINGMDKNLFAQSFFK